MGKLQEAIAEAFTDMGDEEPDKPELSDCDKSDAQGVPWEQLEIGLVNGNGDNGNGDNRNGDNQNGDSRENTTESTTSSTAPTTSLPAKTPDASTAASHSENNTAFDTRYPHRHGWPLLPSLPVRTSHSHIPKTLTPHLTALRALLSSHPLTMHSLTIAHRYHAGTPLKKSTLTLLVQSEVSCKHAWVPALQALRSYVSDHNLALVIEIIDHRIVNGMFTLPILATDPLFAFVERKKRGIARLLDESGARWTSLEFYYRGVGGTRDLCAPFVLIGVPEPEEKVWWMGGESVVSKVGEKVKGRLGVEVVWREVVKY